MSWQLTRGRPARPRPRGHTARHRRRRRPVHRPAAGGARARATGRITLLDPDELADDTLVIPTALMGAPTVMVEKIPAGDRGASLALRTLEEHLGRRADATMPIECGGINSMIPLVVAAAHRAPGRRRRRHGPRVPRAVRWRPSRVYGVPGSPMAIAGRARRARSIIDTGHDNRAMEWLRARRHDPHGRGGAHRRVRDDRRRRPAHRRAAHAQPRHPARARDPRGPRAPRRPLRRARAEPGRHALRARAGSLRGQGRRRERRTIDGFARGNARIVRLRRRTRRLRAARSRTRTSSRASTAGARPSSPTSSACSTPRRPSRSPPRGSATGSGCACWAISTPPMMRTPEALAVFGPAAFGLEDAFQPVESLT